MGGRDIAGVLLARFHNSAEEKMANACGKRAAGMIASRHRRDG